MRNFITVFGFALLTGCTAQGVFESQYLQPVTAPYLAEAKIVVLQHDFDQQYMFTGKPTSQIGENITISMPLGSIVREVCASVFRSYFMYGTVFTDNLSPNLLYTVAIEPEIRNFQYSYDREYQEDVLDMRTNDEGMTRQPLSTITPSIQFALNVRAYDGMGKVLFDKEYDSGVVKGESYIVTSRPHERVNATFHRALEQMMLKVADDIRPYIADVEVDPATVPR